MNIQLCIEDSSCAQNFNARKSRTVLDTLQFGCGVFSTTPIFHDPAGVAHVCSQLE
jgi:hypothetical protein